MAKLTFSFTNQAGDIPTYEFTIKEIDGPYFTFVDEQLDLCDDKVFVLFESFKDCEYNEEHQDFYITNDASQASMYFFENIVSSYIDNNIKEELNFNFFCFETYEDAFKYCISLKEGL